MEIKTYNPPQTKQCPFCAETIQASAIKCRFCNEFLNTNKAKSLQAGHAYDSRPDDAQRTEGSILFEGSPSLWAMASSVMRGLVFFAIAAFLIRYPLEELSIFQQPEPVIPQVVTSPETDSEASIPAPESAITETAAEVSSRFALNEEQLLLFRKYRIIAGIGLATLVILILLMKIAWLKTTCYKVSADRIEWSRGIFDRRVDNLDMFRVIDLKLRRSLLDCIVGIGTVTIITTDKTDPEFDFKKIRNPRKLYDVIKKASLDADRRSNTVHIE